MEAGLQRFLRWVHALSLRARFVRHGPGRWGAKTMKVRLGTRPRGPPVATLPSSRGSAVQQGRQPSSPPHQREGVEVGPYSGGRRPDNLSATNGKANLA